jgi:hypothetical protein
MRTITVEQFLTELAAQNVPDEHLAFRCPMCGTVQSAADFIKANAGKDLDEVDKWLGFSCIGRFTDAGPHKKGTPPGKGCDWTLGGLFKIHELQVEHEGELHPRFEICTPEEAQEHMKQNTADQAA